MEKKYKSPLELVFKKSFEEMTKKEFTIIRLISSIAFGFLGSLIGYLWNMFSNELHSTGYYIVIAIYLSIAWYFLFFAIFCRIRKINK